VDGGGRRPKLAAKLRYGGKVPYEITILQAAEAWGCPPWEIEDAPGAIRWLRLQATYRSARARAEKMAAAAPPED
jgi:hypothetical protein